MRGMAENVVPKSEDSLVVMLAAGFTTAEAAEGSGFCTRTVERKLTVDTFRKRIDDARHTFTDRALQRLLSLRLKHILNIDKLALADAEARVGADGDLPPHAVRLNASKAIVELGNKLRVEDELERRVRSIEEKLAAREKATPQPPVPPPALLPSSVEGGAA